MKETSAVETKAVRETADADHQGVVHQKVVHPVEVHQIVDSHPWIPSVNVRSLLKADAQRMSQVMHTSGIQKKQEKQAVKAEKLHAVADETKVNPAVAEAAVIKAAVAVAPVTDKHIK